MDLSIVVISRNEEAAIEACLGSLLEHTTGMQTEVILVDSASTDRTLEIARKFPITIVSIDPTADLSASAGRYLGTKHASGKYVLFQDGDMVLIRGWIQTALMYLRDERVGAVGGRLYRVYPGEEVNFSHRDTYPLGEVDRLGGAGLYRMDVLEQVGSFNPFVKGEEERELGYRINGAGYAILRVDVPMVFHLEKSVTKTKRDEKARHFTGVGQNMRRYGLRKISWELLWSHRAAFKAHAAFLFVALSLAALLAAGMTTLFIVAVLGLGSAILVLMAVKGRENVYLFFRFAYYVLINLVKGLRLGIPSPEQYKARTSVFTRTSTN